MIENLVEFKQVSKHFDQKYIVQDVSFIIKSQSLTTLIGPNGAGKTTIARILVGLCAPSGGAILKKNNLNIGYAPQHLQLNANIPIKTKDLIKLLGYNDDLSLLKELKSIIDIENILDCKVNDLSGGQLQKVVLLASLISRPELLVLDEPLKFLDINSQQQLYNLLDFLIKNYGMTIFMISHDLFTVMKKSDQVICLNGHICCSGRPKDIPSDPAFVDALSMIGFYMHHHDHNHS